MPTYKQAADLGFKRALELIDTPMLFDTANGYWHMANTLDTCLKYLLITQGDDSRDNYNLVQNALDKVFDERMKDKKVPVPPSAWGKWSRYEGGPWCDDYGWWGIALTRAYRNRVRLGYDQTLSTRILTYAKNSFTAFKFAWDDSEAVPGSGIRGGAWNHEADQAMTGRNNVTNEVLWLFAQRMWDIEQDPVYKSQMDASQKFFLDAMAKEPSEDGSLLTADGLVRERLLGMAKGYPEWTWAGDQGLFMGACLGSNGNSQNAPIGLEFAKKISAKMLDSDGVLHDSISPDSDFNDDYATGKGALMRMWTILDIKPPSNYEPLNIANATAVWNNRPTPNASGTAQYQFGFNWNPAGKPSDKGGEPTFPGGTTDPSKFSMLVCQVAGLAALTAICLNKKLANTEIPASIPAALAAV